MIAAVAFQNFKALRAATVRLGPFNLFIGPNGSGKTSLIQSLLRLRTLAGLPAGSGAAREGGPRIEFSFDPPNEAIRVRLGCVNEMMCDLLNVEHPPGEAGAAAWESLRKRLTRVRAYLFDHYAMVLPSKRDTGLELASNAGNLSAVVAHRAENSPGSFAAMCDEFRRLMPEFVALETRDAGDGRVRLMFRLAGEVAAIDADSVSQGTLYLLAILVLAFQDEPPPVVCIEEADRGVHPRMLREVRDLLYRLSYPGDLGIDRPAVQVVATTHSPYLLDLFKEHPEEVVLANKTGATATFERLSDRKDLAELLREANLGDLWYSGILGGVPGEE